MASNVKTILQMNFTTGEGRNFALKLADPREDITSEQVQEVMELIQDLNFFTKIANGRMKDAKTVQTTTNSFDIIVVEG